MKTLLFLSCTVTVVLGLAPNRFLQRDVLPAQGHVVQEDAQPLIVKRTELWRIEQDTNTEWVPLVQEKEAEVPMVQEKEAEVPLVQEEEAVVPLVQEEEKMVPLVQEKEAEVPLVQEEEAVVPLVQEEEEMVPLVQEEEAEVPLVQEEEKEAVPVMDPGQDMEPAAELQPEEEVDPEMGVEGGLERSEFEEGPILEEESLGVEEPMMELEPLEAERLVGQYLPSDELQRDELQSVFQYELEQEPIMELEPLQEEELGMDSEPFVMGEEPIMELEPFGRHPVMEYNDIMVEEPSMKLEPEMNRVPYSATGRLSVMGEEPVMELEPEEEVDPEMGVEGGLERSEFEGPILEEESLGVEEPMMELEPLEEDRLIGQDLTSDELQQSVFQYELEQEPIMELEPFGRHPAMEYNDIMGEEPSMELEPEFLRVPYSATGRLSVMGEEPVMELEPLEGEESDFSPMKRETPGVEGPLLFEQPIMGEGPMMDGAAHVRVEPVRERRALGKEANRHRVETYITGRRSCPGVILGEKCYQFFKGPKKAADAEFFCQSSFPQGHLASVTSQEVHRQLMDLMLQNNGGYTPTWVGGLRYLQTGRFIWLDGAHWSYDDFLPGEPNNKADVENCIELLAVGNGKFNDMPCWDLRSFICSHTI